MTYLIEAEVLHHGTHETKMFQFWGSNRTGAEQKIQRFRNNPKNKHYEIKVLTFRGYQDES